MVYQCEKTLGELGDKISADEKKGIEDEIAKVKEALKGTDTEAIKNSTDELMKKFGEVSQKIYAQAAQAQQGAEGQPADEEIKVVDDDK